MENASYIVLTFLKKLTVLFLVIIDKETNIELTNSTAKPQDHRKLVSKHS